MRKAIVVLTRGYKDVNSYASLMKRNTCISKSLKDKTMDILIFHEGNILANHQDVIKTTTTELNIKFINVKEKNRAFLKDKEKIKMYPRTNDFGIGYRHMCSFWFVDFWNYMDEYDAILRIDEDCFIDFDVEQIFQQMEKENKIALYGNWSLDHDFVTKELNKFTSLFFKKFVNKRIFPRGPSGPYTNVIALNLRELSKNKLLKKYIEYVSNSNAIYIYRWGDLTLWGEVLTYFYETKDYANLNNIIYYHESHNSQVN
jgi:hypothetical protein